MLNLKNPYFCHSRKRLHLGLSLLWQTRIFRDLACDHVRKDSRFNKEIVMTKSEFSVVGLAHKICLAAEAQGYNPELLNALAEHPSLFEQLLEVQQGRANIVPFEKKPEPVLDTLIRVDRSIRPVYPDWMKTVMHPELESTGLVEYDLGTINPWLHDGQKNGRYMEGNKLYEYLKEQKMLESCLSLRDGEEIQKKGLAVFRKFFQGKAVFLWKSVVRRRGGSLNVPYLYEDDDGVVVGWRWLGSSWDGNDPALRFAS